MKEGLLFGYEWGEKLGWQPSAPIPNSQSPNPQIERFKEAVDDDFNFAGGLPVLFELAKALEREGNILVHEGKTETPASELEKQWHTLVTLANVLGLEAQPEVSEDKADDLSDEDIEAMIQQRAEARKLRDFAEGDRIRNELSRKGITLMISQVCHPLASQLGC
jgi:cysteinyl-tRNA synthetase